MILKLNNGSLFLLLLFLNWVVNYGSKRETWILNDLDLIFRLYNFESGV